MRYMTVAFLAALMLVAPMASATEVRTGQIQTRTPVLGPIFGPSNPAVQNADTYVVALSPGMHIDATLTYTDTSGLPAPNDLDLGLGPPSTPPTPLLPPLGFPPDVPGILAWAELTAAATMVRATCGNFVAQSHTHGVGLGTETISYTVPPAGESGAYRLTVNGFLVTRDQPYTLTITVLDANNADVSSATVSPGTYTPFVRTSAACQFL
jgi:hypothetical protein